MIFSLSIAHILPGRCLELLVIKPMPRGRGNPLRLLLVKGLSRLQQEAVTGSGSRGKATPRRGKGGSLSGGRGSGSAAHVEDNGGTKGKSGRPSPLSFKMTCCLGD
jgi:hypothetical protein